MARQLSPFLCIKKILIRIPNWLGDAVMATGVIEQVHERWPGASIDLLGPPGIIQLLESNPHIKHGFGWKAQGLSKYLPTHPMIQRLRSEKYDLGIILTNSFSTAWQMRLIAPQVRLGFASEGRSFLLTHPSPFPEKRATQHLVITYQKLLKCIDSQADALPIYPPKLYVPPENLQKAKQWMKERFTTQCVVGLNPSAAYGPAKQWPITRFKELAKRLVEEGIGVIIFGEPSARDLGATIAEGLEDSNLCFDICGKTNMKEFVALMACCDALVTNDSGPMHLAAALSKPLVAIFGSTDDTITGPYGCGHVIHKHVECSPCFKRVCPIDFRCMMRIEVDEVHHALKQELHKVVQGPFSWRI